MKKLYTEKEYIIKAAEANASGKKLYVYTYSQETEIEVPVYDEDGNQTGTQKETVTEEFAELKIAPDNYYICYKDNYTDGTINEDLEEQKLQAKQDEFNQEFFLTSLGYIRRKVSMATGETKDFLSDLLPVISMGIQTGQTVPIITYSLPDFTQELTTDYLESLQTVKNVTAEFVQECFLQLSNDFMPISQLQIGE